MLTVVVLMQIPESLGALLPLMADCLHDHYFRLVESPVQQGRDTICRLLPSKQGGIGTLYGGAFGDVDAIQIKPGGVPLTIQHQTTASGAHSIAAELISQKSGEVCTLKLVVCDDTEHAAPLIAASTEESVCDLRGKSETRQLCAVWSVLRDIRLDFRSRFAY